MKRYNVPDTDPPQAAYTLLFEDQFERAKPGWWSGFTWNKLHFVISSYMPAGHPQHCIALWGFNYKAADVDRGTLEEYYDLSNYCNCKFESGPDDNFYYARLLRSP